MAFQIFAVPIRDPAAAQDELNSFLQSHKVLSVDRRWVDQGPDSFWSFCVDYHGSSMKTAQTVRRKKSQVDYREVLNEEDFAVYSELRELRKQVAQQENVAVYVVFTNEQLAEMVQQRAATKADLELERDFLDGRIDELELQQRATSMFAFARAAGVSSWHFRWRVLEQSLVSGRMARTG